MKEMLEQYRSKGDWGNFSWLAMKMKTLASRIKILKWGGLEIE